MQLRPVWNLTVHYRGGDMKQVPYWGPQNIRNHLSKFSRPGHLTPGICVLLHYFSHSFPSQGSVPNQSNPVQSLFKICYKFSSYHVPIFFHFSLSLFNVMWHLMKHVFTKCDVACIAYFRTPPMTILVRCQYCLCTTADTLNTSWNYHLHPWRKL